MADVKAEPPQARTDAQQDEEKVVEQVASAPSTAVVAAPNIDIPDGGYGWICIACVALINANTWGCVTSYGIYLAHYLNADIFVGARALDFAIVGGLQFAISMLLAPLVTPTARRLGTQATIGIGIVIMSLGYVLAGEANGRIWVLYLTQGFMVGSGLSFIFVPAAAILPQWFWKRRTLSVGLTSAGAGLGGLIYSLSTEPMIRNLGLPWALRITGITAFICNTISTIFLRDRNKVIKPTQHGFALYLLKDKRLLLLLGHAFFNMFGYISVLYSISSFALSLGIDQRRASLATAFLNLGTAVGRPFVGLASDRYGRYKVAFWACFVSGILCFALWIPTNSYGLLVFLTVTIGLIMGTFWTTVSALTAEVVGIKETPSALSLVWLSVVIPTLVAEVIALYLRRSPESDRPYIYVQVFSGLSYLVSAIFILILWRSKHPSVDS